MSSDIANYPWQIEGSRTKLSADLELKYSVRRGPRIESGSALYLMARQKRFRKLGRSQKILVCQPAIVIIILCDILLWTELCIPKVRFEAPTLGITEYDCILKYGL